MTLILARALASDFSECYAVSSEFEQMYPLLQKCIVRHSVRIILGPHECCPCSYNCN